MFRVAISPQWTIGRDAGETLAPRVVDVLVKVDEHGSLSAACDAIGSSYRHAWQLLREGEAIFGQPLLAMSRGRGSRLTPLGERLVWAHRRIHARLSPMLDTLASELGAEIDKVVSEEPAHFRIHASHGFAVQALHEHMDRAGLSHELKYCGSAEALQSLRGGSCEVAGFHVPIGEFEADAVEYYRPRLEGATRRIVHLATRRQGLMVAPGNPKKIYGLSDLPRPDVRFINRQSGSGTRFLLDLMLRKRGIDSAAIRGYEQCEFTHAAVAAYVASGMADAAFGVEVPARQFRLEFLPSQTERYFFLCDVRTLESPEMKRMRAMLASDEYRRLVDALPGYEAKSMGTVATLEEAFASFRPRARRAGGPTRRR